MVYAATHLIIALLLGSIVRDYLIRDKKNFPLHYVLLLGIGGILPDIDVFAFWILYFFGFSLSSVHRTFSHTLFLPLIFLLLSSISYNFRKIKFRKVKLSLPIMFSMVGLGVFVHLILDALFSGSIMPFYPFSFISLGFNLVGLLPDALEKIFLPTLDAGLIIIWIVYLELKHKISDFI